MDTTQALVTMSGVVGTNVRAARQARGWTQDRLVLEISRRGGSISKSSLTRIEPGDATGTQKSVSVDELVQLGLALGVAPLVLLCPPPGVDIAAPKGEALLDDYSLLGFVRAREQNMRVIGAVLVHGPWEDEWGPSEGFPTDDDLRAVKAWEKETWRRASMIPGLYSQNELDRLHEEAIEWPERERLIEQAIRLLPSELQWQLDLVKGLWELAEFEDGWRLDQRTNQQLRQWIDANSTKAPMKSGEDDQGGSERLRGSEPRPNHPW
jgi:transcriptional regulator with XRE-family HTH domain